MTIAACVEPKLESLGQLDTRHFFVYMSRILRFNSISSRSWDILKIMTPQLSQPQMATHMWAGFWGSTAYQADLEKSRKKKLKNAGWLPAHICDVLRSFPGVLSGRTFWNFPNRMRKFLDFLGNFDFSWFFRKYFENIWFFHDFSWFSKSPKFFVFYLESSENVLALRTPRNEV